MKEKFKKFINSKLVRTVGLVIVVGGAAYVASIKGVKQGLIGQRVDVNLEGYDIIKIEDKIENSVEEA